MPGLVKIVQLRPDLYGVQMPLVWSYLLVDGEEVVALDTCLGPAGRTIVQWFSKTNRRPNRLRAVLLTHGHLDHSGCAEELRRWSHAAIHLHPADDAIAQGVFRYQGAARFAGILETIGRLAFASPSPRELSPLADGQKLPYWGGLEVVHLPGHTPGHVGFYSRSKRILFCGDSLLYWGGRCRFPFVAFNVNHQQVRESILRVAGWPIDWVYPMHHAGLNRNLIEDVRRYAAKRRGEAHALQQGV